MKKNKLINFLIAVGYVITAILGVAFIVIGGLLTFNII